MANNKKTSNNAKNVEMNDNKVITKYDKKVQERKRQEAKEKKNKLIFRITSLVIAAAIVIGIGIYFIIRHNQIYGEYIKVGDNSITKLEYDYYYQTSVDSFTTNYSQYLSYFGLDTTKSFADQKYSDTLTWDDYFAQQAVELIKQTKALLDDSNKNNFEYDVDENYNTYVNSIKEAASTNSMGVGKYYKTKFGANATESNLKSIIKEYLIAGAYYNQLSEQNKPTDSEVQAYYEQNKDQYDSIDYRVLAVESQDAANEMLSKITDGASFASLSVKYAPDDVKANYESEDASLVTGGTSSSISTTYNSWLYDASRKAGDKTVIENADNGTFDVLYFVNRYYESTNNDTISDTITSENVNKYIATLTANYTVSDPHNKLNYLSVTATEAATQTESESVSQ